GKQFLQVILARVKEGQDEIARLIACIDLIRRPRPMGGRRAVAIDRDRNGDDLIKHHVAQLWTRAAVDHAGRPMKHQVDDARGAVACKQSIEQFFELWPNAGKRGDGSKQGTKNDWPHSKCTAFAEAPRSDSPQTAA